MKVVILYNLSERLITGEYGDLRAEESVEEEMRAVCSALENLGYDHREIIIQNETPIVAIANLLTGLQPTVVFNLVESVYGNSQLEMAIPSMLDLMQIPYTGSGALTLGLCQDKGKSKAILNAARIRTPRYMIFSSNDKVYQDFREKIFTYFPLIVKPLHEDGSLGITANSVIYNFEKIYPAIGYIHDTYKQPAIVEEYIDGREFGVGVIDFDGEPRPFPVSEIIFDEYPPGTAKIISYNAKWNPDTIEYRKSIPNCPANITRGLERRLKSVAMKVFDVMGIKGYCRIDMRVRGNKIYVIDINPNPDLAPPSGITNIISAAGISYTEFIRQLIDGALRG